MKTKKAKMTYVGTLEKKVIPDEELKQILQSASGYEAKMKVYRDYWISDDFIKNNASWISWDLVCRYQPLSSKVIEKHQLDITFDTLVSYQKVSQKILLKYREQINVDKMTRNHPLSEKFISRYYDLLGMCWSNIVFYQKLSLDFLIKYKDKFEVEDLEGGKTDEQTIDNFKIFLKMGVI